MKNKTETNPDDLITTLRITKECRFNAASRLENRDKMLTIHIALTSAYVIVLAIIPLFLDFSPRAVSGCNALAATLSLYILVISLIQHSNNDRVLAQELSQSGQEINELILTIRSQNIQDTSNKISDEYYKRYASILKEYKCSHKRIDFIRTMVENPSLFKKSHFSWYFLYAVNWFRVIISGSYVFALLTLVTFIVAWMIIGYGAYGITISHLLDFTASY